MIIIYKFTKHYNYQEAHLQYKQTHTISKIKKKMLSMVAWFSLSLIRSV